MPLWRRPRTDGDDEVAFARELARFPIVGTLPCTGRDCARRDAAQCAYEDRRANRCTTAVCPIHQMVLHQQPYCRVHAATLEAVGDIPASAMPDIDNLAPAMVSWVARDLHDAVVALLDPLVRRDRGDRLVIDPRPRALRQADGSWRWTQGWRIHSETTATMSVVIGVHEEAAARIRIQVGSAAIAARVSPSLLVSNDAGGAQRADYYAGVVAEIATAIDHEVTLDRRYNR